MYSNILLIKLSAIGDVIHALPDAAALKQRFPAARLTWIVEAPAYDLLTNNPYIDEIIIFEKPKYKSWSGFFRHMPGFRRMLRQRRFDLVLDLQGLFKSAAISFLSGAPKRLVYCDAREGSALVGKKICGPGRGGHIIERYLDVVKALGCSTAAPEFTLIITEREKAAAAAIARQAGLALTSPFVVLLPGTNWASKCWPADKFAQLADCLFEQGVVPVFAGGAADKTIMNQIAGQSAVAPVDITGMTSLKQLAHIIKSARAVVAGDTGPMHLAAALNAPVAALFGPTDAVRNGPYGTKSIILQASHSCCGCWQRKCPQEIDCLADIHVAAVLQAVIDLVQKYG